MSELVLTPNLSDSDLFYEQLMNLHRDLTDGQSAAANARLILLLANHIGDEAVLEQALRIAAEDVTEGVPQ
jgi:3-(3-hydroxy-phenyl)propionate hydroxylase